jgi:hypothetical protein
MVDFKTLGHNKYVFSTAGSKQSFQAVTNPIKFKPFYSRSSVIAERGMVSKEIIPFFFAEVYT